MVRDGYLWNSGIFVWRVGDFLDELRGAHAGGRAAPRGARRRSRRRSSARCTSGIAVDVGVLERSERVLVLPGDFGWDDVGTWAALQARARSATTQGNAVSGLVHALESRGQRRARRRERGRAVRGTRSRRRHARRPDARHDGGQGVRPQEADPVVAHRPPRAGMSAVYLYDDARARTLRAVRADAPDRGDCAPGALLLRERWARALGAPGGRPRHLAVPRGLRGAGAAPVVRDGTNSRGRWLVNARFAPALSAAPRGDVLRGRRAASPRCALDRDVAERRHCRGRRGDARRARRLPSASRRESAAGGWTTSGTTSRHLAAMLDGGHPGARRGDRRRTRPAGAIANRRPRLFVEEGAVVEPQRVLRHERRARSCSAPARTCRRSRDSCGPLYVGERQHRHHRPHRRVVDRRHVQGARRGEQRRSSSATRTRATTASSATRCSGRWVNLGAGTITSNLKNTYGTVQLWTPEGMRDTGMQFLGTMFGDHAKTGIGLASRRARVLGAGANVYGSAMPPKAVAPFAWGEAGSLRRRTASISFSRWPSG